MDKFLSDIGAQIKTLRKKKKLSARELASLSGTSTPAIYEIEKGERNSSLLVIHKIAKALGKKVRISFINKGSSK